MLSEETTRGGKDGHGVNDKGLSARLAVQEGAGGEGEGDEGEGWGNEDWDLIVDDSEDTTTVDSAAIEREDGVAYRVRTIKE